MKEFHPPIRLTTDTGEVFFDEPARHVRTDNARLRKLMRSTPAKDRLLTVVCGTGRTQHMFAAVVGLGRDDVLYLDGFTIHRSVSPFPPSPIGYGCGCGERHMVTFSLVWEHVDRLRREPSKRRHVDVQNVSLPTEQP